MKYDYGADREPAPQSLDFMGSEAQQSMMYLDLADELSADPDFLTHARASYVRGARAYAERLGLSWPPEPDLDKAAADVKRAEARRERDQ